VISGELHPPAALNLQVQNKINNTTRTHPYCRRRNRRRLRFALTDNQNNVSVGLLAGTIHPYPTTAECIRQAAAGYNKNYRTPAANKALDMIMAKAEADQS